MLNIFNLFLFLLLVWSALMLSSQHFTWLYAVFGIIFALLISILAYYLKLIQKNSELLYLSFGFYRHFIGLYLKNFFKSIGLIIDLAISNKNIRPLIYEYKLEYQGIFNPSLMISSINMMAGLFCIKISEDKFIIHAIDERYFNKNEFDIIAKILPQVNDDNLV